MAGSGNLITGQYRRKSRRRSLTSEGNHPSPYMALVALMLAFTQQLKSPILM
jgi:hypothetical protein